MITLRIGAFAWAAWTTTSVTRTLSAETTGLAEAADQVLRAAQEVARASQSLSQGATEQAASLEETSASMEEMASMTRQNAENSRSAATLMTEVDSRVQGSNAALEAMVTSMATIQESSHAGAGNRTVEQVATSISQITDSVQRVKGLVDQVSAASTQQAQGIDHVSHAVAQMEKVTQTTAATAEELNAQAETSMGMIGRIQKLVASTTRRARTAGPSTAQTKHNVAKAA